MSQLVRGISAREVDIRLESHNNIRLMIASWNMGNAKAEGLEHLIPRNGGEYDLIVLGLQESTYNMKEKKDKGDKEDRSGRRIANSDSGDSAERSGAAAGGAAGAAARRKSKYEACVDQLFNQIEDIVGHEFQQVIHNKRGQMQLLVYGRESLAKYITNVEQSAENTGFLHVFPNKGGLCVSFTVHGTSLAFISCHLTAHEGVKNCCFRNESTKEILGGVRSGDVRFDPSAKTHHTFWMGDMNYRITFDRRTPGDLNPSEVMQVTEESQAQATGDENDGLEEESVEDEDKNERAAHFKKVFEMIEAEQWSNLLEFDELNREIKSGRVLNGFHALQPSFPPTFKRKRHIGIKRTPATSDASKEYQLSAKADEKVESFYDPKRIPSFTDRILFKSLPGFKENITTVSFESIEEIFSSDHKPVRASFEIETCGGAKGIHVKPEHKQHGAFTLQISELKGYDLAEMDTQVFGGGSDPYVIMLTDPPQLINASQSKVKSEIIMHNLFPEWKSVLTLNFKSDDYSGMADNAHLFFSVWDYDKFSDDDLIGIFAISMKDIISHLRTAESFEFVHMPLISNGEIQGSLSGRITCVDSKGSPMLLPPESVGFAGGVPNGKSFRLSRQTSQSVRYQTLAEATESPFSDMGSCCTIS